MQKSLEPEQAPTIKIDVSPLHEVLKSYGIPLDLSSEQIYYTLTHLFQEQKEKKTDLLRRKISKLILGLYIYGPYSQTYINFDYLLDEVERVQMIGFRDEFARKLLEFLKEKGNYSIDDMKLYFPIAHLLFELESNSCFKFITSLIVENRETNIRSKLKYLSSLVKAIQCPLGISQQFFKKHKIPIKGFCPFFTMKFENLYFLLLDIKQTYSSVKEGKMTQSDMEWKIQSLKEDLLNVFDCDSVEVFYILCSIVTYDELFYQVMLPKEEIKESEKNSKKQETKVEENSKSNECSDSFCINENIDIENRQKIDFIAPLNREELMRYNKKELIDLFLELFKKIDELTSKVNSLTKQVSLLKIENKSLMNEKKEIEKEKNYNIKLYQVKQNNNNKLNEKNNTQLERKINIVSKRGFYKILFELCHKMSEISIKNEPYSILTNINSQNLCYDIKKFFYHIAHKKHNQNDTVDTLFDALVDYFKRDFSKMDELKKIQEVLKYFKNSDYS